LFEILEYFYSYRQPLSSNFNVQKISVLKIKSFKTYLKCKTQPDLFIFMLDNKNMSISQQNTYKRKNHHRHQS